MPPKDKYTDPELREQVKEEVKQSDKGGAPGQWSARKAQFMAQEYKKRGGDYNTDKSQKDESQQNLSNWTDEDWQTKEGSGNAKKEDGTQKRYLPKKAWDKMTEEEKEETDNKKQEESKEGKQFVENTAKAKDSRKKASKTSGNQKQKSDGDEESADEHGNEEDDDEAEYQDDGEADENEEDDEDDKENAETGEKRKSSKQQNGNSKKQKDNSGNSKSNGTVGSKHMDAKEPGQRGSNDRLPKKGQKAQWKAMPGYVDGEVVEVLTKGKNVDGKSVKASEDDPKIVLKSSSSGKICVHKPDACFYD